jgi:hypothetical protein
LWPLSGSPSPLSHDHPSPGLASHRSPMVITPGGAPLSQPLLFFLSPHMMHLIHTHTCGRGQFADLDAVHAHCQPEWIIGPSLINIQIERMPQYVPGYLGISFSNGDTPTPPPMLAGSNPQHLIGNGEGTFNTQSSSSLPWWPLRSNLALTDCAGLKCRHMRSFTKTCVYVLLSREHERLRTALPRCTVCIP